MSNIDQEITGKLQGNNVIFEKSKFIRQPKTILDINKERDSAKIKNYFGWRRWLDDKFWINTLTLNFNPYREFGTFGLLDGFLSYYEFSKKFVFIPNIKTSKNVYSSEKPFQRTSVPIVDCEMYTKFVDECF